MIMGGGVCDFCGRRGGTLVSVCNCYKKHEDRGRVHLECFKARALELSRCDTTRRPRVCAQCGAEYRLAWSSEFQFVWKRFLSGRSLGIFCQLLMIIVTLLGTLSSLFSVYVHTNSGDDTERESAGDSNKRTMINVLCVILVMTMVMVFFVITKLSSRIKDANSNHELSIV